MASNANFSIVADVEFNTKGIQQKLNKAWKVTRAGSGAVSDLSVSYQTANEVFRKSVKVITNVVGQVYELDSAITELRRVSDLSGQALDDYVSKLTDMGSTVARTGSEMVEAATEFKKSSFNDDDAANLALVATKLQNIADEEISAGEAGSFIISQLKAFGMEAESSTHIIDAL